MARIMTEHQAADTPSTGPDARRGERAPIPDPREQSAPSPVAPVGYRLRAARVDKGLSLSDCGKALHLPIKVLERLEADEFGSAEHFVFLRGALKSYAGFLGLPSGCCDDTLRAVAPAEQPALVSVARTSRTRWLLRRYGTAATYIALTGMIAVPLVLLGLRGGLHRPAARIVSLDQPAVSAPAAPTSAVASHAATQPASPDASPFRASMTPFTAIGIDEDSQSADAASAQANGPLPAAPGGQHILTLAASADCWFELTDAEGNKVDSGLLHAGDTRSWHSAGVLHVTLGNAGGVAVTQDGQPLDPGSYQRANVAHFDVFGSPGASEND